MKKIVAVFMVLGMVGCSSANTTTIACSYSDDSQGFLTDDVLTVVADAEDQIVSLGQETQLSTWTEESGIGYTEYSELIKAYAEEDNATAAEYGYTLATTYDDENQVIAISIMYEYATLAEGTIEELYLPTTGAEAKETLESAGYVCE
ncbi:MAG: hypothetical protein ACK5LZ_01290 [Anaerorhabdus sp.]